MKEFVYKGVEKVLRLVFPDSWVNKDTVGAVLAIIGVSLVLSALAFVTGCAGGMGYVKYHHNSSIPDFNDANTSDRIGGCGMWYLGVQQYAPQMHVCIDRELTKKPVFSQNNPDIVGDVKVVQPIYMWGRR